MDPIRACAGRAGSSREPPRPLAGGRAFAERALSIDTYDPEQLSVGVASAALSKAADAKEASASRALPWLAERC